MNDRTTIYIMDAQLKDGRSPDNTVSLSKVFIETIARAKAEDDWAAKIKLRLIMGRFLEGLQLIWWRLRIGCIVG